MTKFLFIINLILFVLGGIGRYNWTIQLSAVGVLLIELLIFLRKKISFPPNFRLFAIFIIVLIIHSYLFNPNPYDTLNVTTLFISGGLFYLLSYNLASEFKQNLKWWFITTGIVFGSLFLYHLFTKSFMMIPWSLDQSYNRVFNHFHIGDLWAVIIPYLFALKAKGEKIDSSLILFGFIIIFLSLSRSAYVSTFISLVFFILSEKHLKINKKLLIVGGVIIVLGFLYAGSKKGTLFERPYYVQGLVATVRHPLGYGTGNFIAVSSDPENSLGLFTGLTRNAHNLFLEILPGMGIFSLPFFYWVYKTAKDVKIKSERNNLLLPAFISILINFMFDPTYFISTMFWFALILLGLVQSGGPLPEKKKNLNR